MKIFNKELFQLSTPPTLEEQIASLQRQKAYWEGKIEICRKGGYAAFDLLTVEEMHDIVEQKTRKIWQLSLKLQSQRKNV